MHYCSYCDYKSNHKWVVTRHMNAIHRDRSTVPIEQNVPQRSGQNEYQSQDVDACIRQWQEAYQNIGARYQQSEKEKAEIIQYCNAQSSRAPTTISVGPDCPKPPTTVSVPPLGSTNQYGDGVGMDMDNESVESDNESILDDEENEERSFWVIAEEIRNTFLDLCDLRTEYRQALPQLKELTEKDLKLALKTYAWLEATVYNDRYGLEEEKREYEKGKKLRGKGIDDSESEGETDEESVDDPDDISVNSDTEDIESNGDTDEEAVDDEDTANDADTEASDDEEEEESRYVNESNNDDSVINGKEEDDDDFWDFIFEARGFIENKTMLEKYVTWAKTTIAVFNDYEKDQGDKAKNRKQMFKDLDTVLERYEEHGVGCFEQVSNRKIHSLCRIAEMFADTEAIIKKANLNEYKKFLKMMGPKLKSYRKLVDPNISIHKKRSELKKAQVGTGILDAAVNLLIPVATNHGKKRKFDN